MKVFRMLFVCVALVTTVNTAAQDFGTFAFGPKVGYATGHGYHHPGFGLTLQRLDVFSEYLRMNFSGMYYPRHDEVWMVEGTAGFDYVFPIGKKVGIYPSVSFAYQVTHAKNTDYVPEFLEEYTDRNLEDGSLGISFGAGVEYYPQPWCKVFLETRYLYATYSEINPNHHTLLVGFAYVW